MIKSIYTVAKCQCSLLVPSCNSRYQQILKMVLLKFPRGISASTYFRKAQESEENVKNALVKQN